MVYMGIDQSLTGTGVAVYDGHDFYYHLFGTEKTKKTKCPTIDRTRRLMTLKAQLRSLIEQYKPDLIGMEGMAFGAQGAAIFDIGGLSHIFRELFIEMGLKFIIAPPTVIKKHWTGKGNANKMLMIETAEFRGVEIPFVKKYTDHPEKKFDDNVVDAHAICNFLTEYEKHIANIECSWDV